MDVGGTDIAPSKYVPNRDSVGTDRGLVLREKMKNKINKSVMLLI